MSDGQAAKDWLAWHADYADPTSAHSARLRAAQQAIREVLPTEPRETFQIVSLCAGQGDDVIGALDGYPYRDRVRARLVELDPRNMSRMKQKVAAAGLGQFDLVLGDAADTAIYADVVPADLVLLCGIFGNISNDDVMRTVEAMPQFCSVGARVIWTRSRRSPDLTPAIRGAFLDAGFTETGFVAPDAVEWSVGTARFDAEPQPLPAGTLFTFVD